MLHGFERTATTEPKFIRLSKALADLGIPSLRVDFAGIGLSEGDYKNTTVESMTSDLIVVIDDLKSRYGFEKISIVAHSLGACVVANLLNKNRNDLHKFVLIAPALNQRDLMRYWFTVNQLSKTNPEIKVDWNNFKNYLDEAAFLKDSLHKKITKAHVVGAEYFLENRANDYLNNFLGYEDKVLFVQGTKDDKVPIESLNVNLPNKILVENADHDIEKPGLWEEWTKQAAEFFKI